MANLKASKKDIRKTSRRTEQNRQVRSRLKTLAKKVKKLASESPENAAAVAREYVAALDKAAKTNVIHHNKASRHKSQVAKYIFESKAA